MITPTSVISMQTDQHTILSPSAPLTSDSQRPTAPASSAMPLFTISQRNASNASASSQSSSRSPSSSSASLSSSSSQSSTAPPMPALNNIMAMVSSISFRFNLTIASLVICLLHKLHSREPLHLLLLNLLQLSHKAPLHLAVQHLHLLVHQLLQPLQLNNHRIQYYR